MIQLIQEYWRNYLFTDGYRTTGLAITMWLLVVSIGIGFCLSVPLAVAAALLITCAGCIVPVRRILRFRPMEVLRGL